MCICMTMNVCVHYAYIYMFYVNVLCMYAHVFMCMCLHWMYWQSIEGLVFPAIVAMLITYLKKNVSLLFSYRWRNWALWRSCNQCNVTQIINGIDWIGSLTPGLCYSVQAPSLEYHEYTKGGHSPAGVSVGKLLLGAQLWGAQFKFWGPTWSQVQNV